MTLSEALKSPDAVEAAANCITGYGRNYARHLAETVLTAAVAVAEKMVGKTCFECGADLVTLCLECNPLASTPSDAKLRERIAWLESLFDFSDPEIVLHSAPNDPVTKDAVVVLRKHYEAKSNAKLREALMKIADLDHVDDAGYAMFNLADAIEIARAALAAPAQEK